MGSSAAKFPNRDFNFRLESSVVSGTVYYSLYADRIGGNSQSWSASNSSSWAVYLNGGLINSLGGINFDFRGSASSFLIYSGSFAGPGGTHWLSAGADYSVLGFAQTGHYITVGSVPPAPIPVAVDQPTVTSLRYRFNSAGDGGSPITSYGVLVDDDPAFGSPMLVDGGSGTVIVTGLNPDTEYSFKVRAQNAIGLGPDSTVLTGRTLAASAPGMVVTPTLSGSGASVALSAPGGVSGVSKYTVEYQLLPSGSTVSVDTVSSPLAVAGLAPGASYRWRAAAWFGSSQSPWTAWTTVVQPNTNTAPGDYFDGATPDSADLDFGWTGTANNSVSTATGVGVAGWSVAVVGAGSAVLQRVTGGRSGTFGARVTVINDAAFVRVGMVGAAGSWAPVEDGGIYYGSAHARTLSGVTVRPELTWWDGAGAVISRVLGAPVALPADPAAWPRVSAFGTAPENAERATAAVVLENVPGGTTLLLDDIMVSLGPLDWFSGDSPDTPGIDNVWLGTPNASISERWLVSTLGYNPLQDPDCDPIPAPPLPPTIPAECIVETGTWRRYVLNIPGTEVARWTATLPTLILKTSGQDERQVRIRIYANPDNLPPEAMDLTGAWVSEMILTYVPAYTVITLDGVMQAAWAQVGSATIPPESVDSIPANELLYGTGGVPASWPVLRCGDGYVVTFDVPTTAPSGNLTPTVFLTERM